MQRTHNSPEACSIHARSIWIPARCLLGYKRLTPPSAERVTIRSASKEWTETSLSILTSPSQTLIILRSTFKTMTLTAKFKKDVQTLRGAANGDFYLDVKNPKLYKKVRRFYENEGVVFSGDPLDDYEMLMEYVLADLESVEVA